MSLHHIVIRREKIEMPDGQVFEVRGITANDLMSLVGQQGAVLAMIYARAVESRSGGRPLMEDDVKGLLVKLATDFPDVVAAIIAHASDSPDAKGMEIARNLPFTTQIEALLAVFSITFASEAEVKKLVESLSTILTAISGALAEVDPASVTGIGASAAA